VRRAAWTIFGGVVYVVVVEIVRARLRRAGEGFEERWIRG
jgi:hypothetical protein